MQVTLDRKKGTLTISQEDYTKSILAKFGMENCKPSSIPGTGLELSTEQPAETLLKAEQSQRYQAITGSVVYLAQITHYDVMYAVYQLARMMSKPSKAHMGAAKQLLGYLAGTTDFSIVYKRGGFKLSAFSDANWGNNPDNGKSTSAYLVMLSKPPFSIGSESIPGVLHPSTFFALTLQVFEPGANRQEDLFSIGLKSVAESSIFHLILKFG